MPPLICAGFEGIKSKITKDPRSSALIGMEIKGSRKITRV